jgi:hypothetical protein
VATDAKNHSKGAEGKQHHVQNITLLTRKQGDSIKLKKRAFLLHAQ